MKHDLAPRKTWTGTLLIRRVFMVFSALVLVRVSRAGEVPVATPAPEEWQPAAQTIVVFNPAFEGSEELAKFYAANRHIAADHLVGLVCPTTETITRDEFENTIREPLLRKLNEKKWWVVEKRDVLDPNGRPRGQELQVVKQDIRVIVLMRGMPLRVKRSQDKAELPVTEADEASVDSELSALGLLQRPIKGPLENRYYESTRRFPEHKETRGQFITGRLDAADDDTVKRMIKDTINAEYDGLWGRAVVDFALRDGSYLEGEKWLGNCVKLFRETGIPVFADRNKEVIREGWPLPDTILYFGWYADKMSGALASDKFRFKPGAIACHLHSFSAETLRSSDARWCAPMLEHGAAAVLGNVWEPYLSLTTHFDVFTSRLTEGFTLGEAMWSATPVLSWMNVLVGDPLYRPFMRDTKGRKPRAEDADYVVYQEAAKRLALQDGKKFRRELMRLAAERKTSSFIEFAGLFSTLEGKFGEAEDFFQHAQATHLDVNARLRCALYGAELELRRGNVADGNELIREITRTPEKFTTTLPSPVPVAMDLPGGGRIE